jgi:S1-C subfamily serine protease
MLRWGTGFLVRTETNNWYVITAAHVAAEPFSYMAKVSLSLSDGSTVDARMVLPHDKWNFHPDVGDKEHFRTDVAAMKIHVFGGGLISLFYCPTKCPANEYNQVDIDPEPMS